MKERSWGLTLFIAIVAVVVLFLAWDLGRHELSFVQMNAESKWLDDRVARAEQQNQQLVSVKREVQTDTWVERFVRTYWHWTKPNEQIVVNRATPVISPTPPPKPPVEQPPQRSFIEDILDALFGPVK